MSDNIDSILHVKISVIMIVLPLHLRVMCRNVLYSRLPEHMHWCTCRSCTAQLAVRMPSRFVWYISFFCTSLFHPTLKHIYKTL